MIDIGKEIKIYDKFKHNDDFVLKKTLFVDEKYFLGTFYNEDGWYGDAEFTVLINRETGEVMSDEPSYPF